jgi:hypothetical protein
MGTTGFTLHKHYCLGKLKHITVFDEAKTCMSEMGDENESCPMDCCDTTSEQLQVEDLQKVHYQFDFTPQFKLISLVEYLLTDQLDNHDSQADFSAYQHSPPLIEHDIYISVQSFLL